MLKVKSADKMASKNVGSTFRRTAANKKTFAETHTDTVAPIHTHTLTHTVFLYYSLSVIVLIEECVYVFLLPAK